jgi:small subunit ribosomal protein S2
LGLKKQASQFISKAALECDSFMLMRNGGMLTNWQTIQLSIKKLKYLETSLTHGL